MKNLRSLRQRGFTMIEMMVVMAILAPVLGIAFSGMTAVMTTSALATVQVGAQRQLIFTSKRVRKDLRRCNVVGVAPDGLSITYQVPVDEVGSGLAVDALGAIVWGAQEAAGPVAGSSYTLRFVQDSLVQEMTVQSDLNNDGDLVDSFRLGHLERTTTQGTLIRFSPGIFLVDAFVPTGDLDGDGLPDPQFSWLAGQPITMRVLAQVVMPDGKVSANFSQMRIYLPNMESIND